MKLSLHFPVFTCALIQVVFGELVIPLEGMVWIPAGDFAMGNALGGGRQDEIPVIKVTLDGFWLDACDVTNAQFSKFVAATAYKTVAERPIDWEELKKQVEPGTPRPPDEELQPGAVTFVPQPRVVNPKEEETWWAWTHAADWRHPEGMRVKLSQKLPCFVEIPTFLPLIVAAISDQHFFEGDGFRSFASQRTDHSFQPGDASC